MGVGAFCFSFLQISEVQPELVQWVYDKLCSQNIDTQTLRDTNAFLQLRHNIVLKYVLHF